MVCRLERGDPFISLVETLG